MYDSVLYDIFVGEITLNYNVFDASLDKFIP
jgi:hypothetical protein